MFKKINDRITNFRKDYGQHCQDNRNEFNKISEKINFFRSRKVEGYIFPGGLGREKGIYHVNENIPVKDVVQMILDYLELELDEVDVEKIEKGFGLKRKEDK